MKGKKRLLFPLYFVHKDIKYQMCIPGVAMQGHVSQNVDKVDVLVSIFIKFNN